MSDRRDPSGYNLRLSTAPPQTVAPAVSKLSTTVNLANGASISFDFNIDQTPFADMMVSSDRNLSITTLVRIDQNDTFRQIDNPIPYNAGATYDRMLDGKRFPGSVFRVTILNNSGAPTTRLSAEVQVRSS